MDRKMNDQPRKKKTMPRDTAVTGMKAHKQTTYNVLGHDIQQTRSLWCQALKFNKQYFHSVAEQQLHQLRPGAKYIDGYMHK